MIVKGISIRCVANSGSIIPLHEATFVDEDDIGTGVISDQYGLKSVLKKQLKAEMFLVSLTSFQVIYI